jgi:hypothetical protein
MNTAARKMRVISVILCLLVVAFAGLFHLLLADKQETWAQANNSELGEFRVVADSMNRLDGWNVEFCWRRHDRAPWMLYYLDHESPRWRDGVRISVSEGSVVVSRGNNEIGRLNTSDGSFLHHRTGKYQHPAAIVLSADPFCRACQVSSGSPGWASLWPDVKDRGQ